MTSASGMFFSRRIRIGRGSEDLELDTGRDLSSGHHRRSHSQRRQSNRRHGLDDCLPVRRPGQSRTEEYGSAFMEGMPFAINEGINQYEYTHRNSVAEEAFSDMSNRSRVTCSERLPGAVLQAKERLLHRLRGAAVSERRPATNLFNDELRLLDAGDWETDSFIGFSPGEGTSASPLFHSELCKKPLGLTQEVLNSLPVEIFSRTGCKVSSVDNKLVTWDCNICLEKFSEGNQLVCLPCSHRFHLGCIGRWGLIRGDCPCCRRNIV